MCALARGDSLRSHANICARGLRFVLVTQSLILGAFFGGSEDEYTHFYTMYVTHDISTQTWCLRYPGLFRPLFFLNFNFNFNFFFF